MRPNVTLVAFLSKTTETENFKYSPQNPKTKTIAMKRVYIPIALLFLTLQMFAQEAGHGKAAKANTAGEEKPIDPKAKAALQEIADRMVKVEGGTFTIDDGTTAASTGAYIKGMKARINYIDN